jgi:hypothetical protein
VRLRPPTPEDAETVLALIVARDVADYGEPDYTLADLREEWDASDVDLARDTVVVEDDDGALIGYAIVRSPAFAAFNAAGLAGAHLGVASDNPSALRLYERAGMTQRFRVDVLERAAD